MHNLYVLNIVSDAAIKTPGLEGKLEQVFNADETRIGKKESTNTEKVIGTVGQPSHKREVLLHIFFINY